MITVYLLNGPHDGQSFELSPTALRNEALIRLDFPTTGQPPSYHRYTSNGPVSALDTVIYLEYEGRLGYYDQPPEEPLEDGEEELR